MNIDIGTITYERIKVKCACQGKWNKMIVSTNLRPLITFINGVAVWLDIEPCGRCNGLGYFYEIKEKE